MSNCVLLQEYHLAACFCYGRYLKMKDPDFYPAVMDSKRFEDIFFKDGFCHDSILTVSIYLVVPRM